MAFFTKEWYENMQDANVLVLPESDKEWADFIRSFEEEGEDVHTYLSDDLKQKKGLLLKLLPKEFHSFIEDGSINQPYLPKDVGIRLSAWLKGKQEEYEKVLEQARAHFDSICDQIPEGFVKLQENGLHDASILYIARIDDTIRLTLDGAGSFNAAAFIVLTFNKVDEDYSDFPLQEGQYWLYEEVDVHRSGAIFRVLLDRPMTQWSVVARDVTMEHYYKANSLPFWQEKEIIIGTSAEEIAEAKERLQVTLPQEYVELLAEQNGGYLTHDLIATAGAMVDVGRLFSIAELVRNGEFVWISQNVALRFSKDSEPIVVYKSVGQIAENFKQFLERCVSTEYVDEFAIYSVPLMDEELEPALLGEDLELMVRAWNTMYERPKDFVPLIEKGLLFLLVQKDENLLNMGTTYAYLFEDKGVFTEDFKERLKGFIPEN